MPRAGDDATVDGDGEAKGRGSKRQRDRTLVR
jgi:hypothetical protein